MKTVMLISQDCPSCRVLENKLKDEISKGLIRIVDIASDEGADIAKELGIHNIPEIVTIVETEDGEKVGLKNKVKVDGAKNEEDTNQAGGDARKDT